MEMDVGRRGKARVGVVAGSVWESRMKLDEFRGGIKVFDDGEDSDDDNELVADGDDDLQVLGTSSPKPNLVGASGKRRTWKSEMFGGFHRGPIQIARQRSEMNKSLDFDELGESAVGLKRSPTLVKKTRAEVVGRALISSADGINKSNGNGSSLGRLKLDSNNKELGESSGGNVRDSELRKVVSEGNMALDEAVDRTDEENPAQLIKGKSTSVRDLNSAGNENKKSPVVLKKTKLEEKKVIVNKYRETVGSSERVERIPSVIKKTGSDEDCRELGGLEEKVIMTSTLRNVGQVESPVDVVVTNDKNNNGVEEAWDDDLWEDVEEEIEAEESFDVKEISISQQTPKKTVIEKLHHNERPVPISPTGKKEKPPHSIAKFQPNNGKNMPHSLSPTAKSQQISEKSVPSSLFVRRQHLSAVNYSRSQPNPTKITSAPVSCGFNRISRAHNKLRTLVDLIMWRDAIRTAFVFGIGTFLIILSSYTKDLDLSLISTVSHLGLVYLAAIFIFRFVIYRESTDVEDKSNSCVVGEDEAIQMLKFILPYLNEFLLRFRALFSGDPATIMKLAAMLLVLASCGSYLTVWNLGKLSFFGVFTIPKVCSSCSNELTEYGKFYIQHFQDAWYSCSHKKAVAIGIFTLVWNLSSTIGRIWAVFILCVAYKCYQQSSMRGDLTKEATIGAGDTLQGQNGRHKMGNKPTSVDLKKQKKRY